MLMWGGPVLVEGFPSWQGGVLSPAWGSQPSVGDPSMGWGSHSSAWFPAWHGTSSPVW